MTVRKNELIRSTTDGVLRDTTNPSRSLADVSTLAGPKLHQASRGGHNMGLNSRVNKVTHHPCQLLCQPSKTHTQRPRIVTITSLTQPPLPTCHQNVIHLTKTEFHRITTSDTPRPHRPARSATKVPRRALATPCRLAVRGETKLQPGSTLAA